MNNKQEVGINNIDVYLDLMQKGMGDKLFFKDRLSSEVDTFVDFGCADGTMLRVLNALDSSKRLIGYDISERMIEIAKANAPGIEFFSNWEDIKIDFSNSCLILSSVIHEVYSYGTAEDVEMFWKRVFSSGFRYVVIRDMMFSELDEQPIDLCEKAKIADNDSYSEVLESFEKVNGEITSSKQLLHFLLKYQYFDNWEREVRENYLPTSLEELLTKIPDNYEQVYFSHETLPYIAACIKRDFNIALNMKTHVKIILEHKENKQ